MKIIQLRHGPTFGIFSFYAPNIPINSVLFYGDKMV